jgi:hypothetical protein
MAYDEAMLENERKRAEYDRQQREARFHQQRIESRQRRIDHAFAQAQANGQVEASKGSTAALLAEGLADPAKIDRQQRANMKRGNAEILPAAKAEAERLAKMQPKIPNDPRLAQSSAYFAETRAGEFTDSAGKTRGESGGRRDPEKIAGWSPDPQPDTVADIGFGVD